MALAPGIIERYLRLGLRLGRHIEGFVDAYYGPPALADEVKVEGLTPPSHLVLEAEALGDLADELENEQRARWLRAQLDGMGATAERLDGRPITYSQEVQRCYGVAPEPITEDELAEVHHKLEKLIPGSGPLRERYLAWRASSEIPADRLLVILQAVNQELRRLTMERFGLPAGESVELDLVSDQPWAGFNYYLGRLRSRVVLNTDVPSWAQFLVEAAAHESYPGHHTEHAWKERLLTDGQGRLEESIMLTGTPQSLVSEGIATNALDAIGAEAERAAADLLAVHGVRYEVELSRAVFAVTAPLGRVRHNVALMIHEQKRSPDEARAFADRWWLRSEAEVNQMMDFAMSPVWRAYVIVYAVGERLVKEWCASRPERYRHLLTEQLTTADLTTDGGVAPTRTGG